MANPNMAFYEGIMIDASMLMNHLGHLGIWEAFVIAYFCRYGSL